jgi:RNA polymerase sigma-70 factor (ECF subfamily)
MIDADAFTALTESHRRELQVHCYRMVGSFEESEDLVQETLLRAWRKRDHYAGRASVRAWLYKIATNACLDAIAKRPKLARPSDPSAPVEVPWLQPFPDRLMAPREDEPDAVVVEKETIELAFLVAIQLLPPNQRAVLILRDVVGWSAKETAELLDTSVASANSALQRARATLRARLPARRAEWSAPAADIAEQALLRRYIAATEHPDPHAFVEMLREDAVFSMPPQAGMWVGNERIVDAWLTGGFGSEEFGELRCLLTSANRQPAVANYLRKPGWSEHRALALDVLRIEDGAITEIVTFHPPVFPAFDLPETLD